MNVRLQNHGDTATDIVCPSALTELTGDTHLSSDDSALLLDFLPLAAQTFL